jgi:kynureninase
MNRSIPDPLLRVRPEFPILEKTTYLISNSLGAMLRSAAAALAEYAETRASRGVRAWSDSWWEMSASVGDDIATLIGAPAGSVSMFPNVTTASAVLMTALDYTKDAELDRAFDAMEVIRERGAWRQSQRPQSLIT